MSTGYIFDCLSSNAEKSGDKLALVAGGRRLTWSQLAAEVDKRTAFFISKLPDDEQAVVAMVMPNGWEIIVTYLAVIKAGHIGLPVDVIYKPLEIEAILKQMSPALTIVDADNRSRIGAQKAVLFDEIAEVTTSKEPLRLGPEKQLASLVFTSGTTGKPKAAPYTHANHLWNIEVCSQAWGWGNDDTMLISLRIAHWYGVCMGVSGALYHGNTLFIDDRFDPKKTLQTLASGKISLFTHGPLAYARLLEVEGDYDLSSLRLAISGSAALAPDLWQSFRDRFGVEIIECYGSSETGRIASNTFDERLTGTPGRLLAGVEAKLNEENELLIRSPGLFPGYFNNPEATRQKLDNQGFWHTGDIAELKDNHVYLRSRLMERIRKQGYSVSPRDIEWALRENPKVTDCLVVGTGPDSDNSQLVYFIVGHISENELIDYSKQNLPSIWRPDKVVFMESLPRRTNGKVDLPKLKAMAS